MSKAAIIGAGVMGSAMSWPLSDNGHAVHLVGTHLDAEIISSCKEHHYHPRLKRPLPEKVKPYFIEEIAQALDGIDFIICGVNSLGVHWIGQTLAPFIKPGDKILSVTKGLEADELGNLVILPNVLKSELPAGVRDQVHIAAVGGPCIAGELAARRQSCVVFAAANLDTAEFFKKTLHTLYYHIWTSADLVGVEIAVALKNAYAMTVGLADGILEKSGGMDSAGAGMHNLAAALFAQSCNEIHRLLEILGANPSLAFGLPGAGDLYVTCQKGRSYRLGKLLGEGMYFKQASEMMKGETLESALVVQQMAKALPDLISKGAISKKDFPLMHHLIEVICFQKPVQLKLNNFFI